MPPSEKRHNPSQNRRLQMVEMGASNPDPLHRMQGAGIDR